MYEDITPETIKADILDGIDLWDTGVGSFAYTLIAPVGYELWKYYTQLEAMVSMVFPDETSGLWIDKHANQYGIERKPGEKARCSITFSGTSGTVIPAGKVFLNEEGRRYTLDEAVTLAGGTGTGALTAEEAGAAYNTGENTITIQQTPLRGLTGWTTTAAAGGVDEETDESLLERYYDRLRKPATSGNVYHYEQWAREVPGVGAAKVYPLWEGPGTVKVVIAGDGYTVPDEEVVEAAAAHIEEQRPIGADVTVEAGEALTVNTAATVELREGASLEAVKAEFSGKLADYLLSLAFSADTEVVLTYVGHLLAECSGVYDYTGLTLSGKAENLPVGETDIPVLGEVSLTGGEVN